MYSAANNINTISLIDVFFESRVVLFNIILNQTKSTQTAQDITQELYLKIKSLSNRFPTNDDARNYLIRVAINAAKDHTRSEIRRQQLLQGSLELFENYQSKNPIEDDFILKEEVKTITSILNQLPERYREILYLSRIEGYTHIEIAKKLNISKSSVEKYIMKALLFCRNNIND
ncbi:RNA polymerase sigma factor [Acinetobacter guillouiae]|uniref:RNA polymerase sigma factor n=1 Tax=Acinetobacter guillouiae TaxID=106649 RepID=A0A8X8GCE3_ACIGI|nr:RNA polymerase sigma factor [Acinetobacter guillouiae]MCF0263858.1 RNA polymerase sigma factor [Acinetobacter guillouiae]